MKLKRLTRNKKMKTGVSSFLILMAVIFGINITAYSQTKISCDPAAKEILEGIKSAYEVLPDAEKFLIIGESRSAGFIPRPNQPVTLTQIIAMTGGMLKTAGKSIYIIRQSDSGPNKLELDYNAIRRGETKDLLLEKGDVIFIPRTCADGKILLPTKLPQNSPLISSKGSGGTILY
jgi:hypothetical protein